MKRLACIWQGRGPDGAAHTRQCVSMAIPHRRVCPRCGLAMLRSKVGSSELPECK